MRFSKTRGLTCKAMVEAGEQVKSGRVFIKPKPEIKMKNMCKICTIVLAVSMLASVASAVDLAAYWDFDEFTAGDGNPAGMPQGTAVSEGTFTDQSGNANTLYAGEIGGSGLSPYTSAGKFGGAFQAVSPGANSGKFPFAAAFDSTSINFTNASFTVSFWEMVQYRNLVGGWVDGSGRCMFFAKAPHVTDATVAGYGLELLQNKLKIQGNADGNLQDVLSGAEYTYPTPTGPGFDSGVWAHWALTFQYNQGTDDYTITTYQNGSKVDWNSAVGTTVDVAHDIINTTGHLTIGTFWRNNGVASQRTITHNMRDTSAGQVDSKGWMDDFAMMDACLTEGEAIATLNLGNHAELQYPMGDVVPLLNVHAAGSGSAEIGSTTWNYASGLSGTDGQLTKSAGTFTLVLNSGAGTGLTATPPVLAPTAAFTATPLSGLDPLTVVFTDTSTDVPTSWAWDFENDGTPDSTLQNPTNIFSAGTYSVKLSVSNASGADSVTNDNYITVTVPPAPTASFTATPLSGLDPLTVVFTDTSIDLPTSWEWDFENDGTPDSTLQNPTNIFSAGTYSVKLTAFNATGSNSVTNVNYITVIAPSAPTASFTATPLSGVDPLTVVFTDTSIDLPTAWEWDFENDGTPDSTDQNPTKIFSAGTYSVKLTASNATGSNSVTNVSYIVVSATVSPTAAFSATPLSGDGPLTVVFTDESTDIPTSWSWDFEDDDTPDSTEQNPTYIFAAGTYSVKLTVSNGAGADSLTKSSYITVTVVPTLRAYWTFDTIDTSTAWPGGVPFATDMKAGTKGLFEDTTGRGNTMYAGNTYEDDEGEPYDVSGGQFGGAFYTDTSDGGNGPLGAVLHSADITLGNKPFAVSLWQKSTTRLATGGWAVGSDRAIMFSKFDYDGTDVGLGFKYNQNKIHVSHGDSCATAYGALSYTQPVGAPYGDGAYAHYVITYEPAVTPADGQVRVYANGVQIMADQMDASVFASTTAMCLGHGFGGDGTDTSGALTWQRSLAGMGTGNRNPGWVDDMAFMGRALTAGEVMGTYNLGTQAELLYPMSSVSQLLDIHEAGSGSAVIGDLTWVYAEGLIGTDGELIAGGSAFTLILDSSAGTGVTGSPAPSGTIIFIR